MQMRHFGGSFLAKREALQIFLLATTGGISERLFMRTEDPSRTFDKGRHRLMCSHAADWHLSGSPNHPSPGFPSSSRQTCVPRSGREGAPTQGGICCAPYEHISPSHRYLQIHLLLATRCGAAKRARRQAKFDCELSTLVAQFRLGTYCSYRHVHCVRLGHGGPPQ